jgi:hypothetical protein
MGEQELDYKKIYRRLVQCVSRLRRKEPAQ